jgi:hypothetical protein
MKKYFNFLIPFSMLFIIAPLVLSGTAVAAGTYGTPVQDWGIEIGDTYYYTLGWDLNLDISQGIWDLIDEALVSVGVPAELANAEGHYNNFSTIDSVYNVKIGIANMTSYFYDGGSYNYSEDYITGPVEFKAASQDDYGPLNATLIYEIEQNKDMLDYYLTVFGANMTTDWMIGNLSLYGPGPEDIMYMQAWANSEDGETINLPESPPIFVPKDWDITPFYEQLKSMVNYTELAMYAHIYASDWNDLTSQLGFTTLDVSAKELDLNFKLSEMNQTILDENIYAANLTNPETMTRMQTFDELTGFLNITDLDLSVNGHLLWDRDGVLKNLHIDFTLEGKYEGYSFKITPQFDISAGEHDKINSAYKIPGYSSLLVLAVGLVTISGIVVVTKKFKTK